MKSYLAVRAVVSVVVSVATALATLVVFAIGTAAPALADSHLTREHTTAEHIEAEHTKAEHSASEHLRAERNKALARELFAALSRGDVAWLDAHYAEDFELWTAGSLPFSGTSGRAAALEGMRGISAVFPTGIEFIITAMTAEGDRVAIEAESDGLHVSGKTYHNYYHFLMVARAGKITRFKEYLDTQHAFDVLMSPPVSAPPAAKGGSTRLEKPQ